MRQFVCSILIVVGIGIALFGIGIDALLPGASPGINLPQLLVVAAGLAVSLVALTMRRGKLRWRSDGRLAKKVALVAIIALLTLLVLELVLTLWGMPTYFHAALPHHDFRVLPWWTCETAEGCRYVSDVVVPACESGELSGRECLLNQQGYADSSDFVAVDASNQQLRILLLGDSFTFGYSADVGMSFAERLTADQPQAIIWNAGIQGTGTNQALATFTTYGPLLRPQLTILGFFTNDFDDNLLPLNSWLYVKEPADNFVFARKYKIDNNENVIDFDLSDRHYLLTYKQTPPTTEFERRVGLTRLGTLLLRLRDSLDTIRPATERFDKRIKVTRQYLQELQKAVAESGSDLLALLIPRHDDLGREGERYQFAQEVMADLRIPYMSVVDLLDPVADYAVPPDGHWNNAGHQKVGARLSECVSVFSASGSLADCTAVTMPLAQRIQSRPD